MEDLPFACLMLFLRIPAKGWKEPFIQRGAVALGAFTVAIILASRPIRHFAYELFLVLHIILVL
jgi:hypothetical protein